MPKNIRPSPAAADRSVSLPRLVCDSLPALIAYVDAEQRYRFVNHAYEEWFGLGREKIEGRRLVDVLGVERYQENRAAVEEALGGVASSFTTRRLGRDGKTYDFEAHILPHIGSGGQIDGCFVFILDITERKRIEAVSRETERRYQTLFREMSEGFVVYEVMFDEAGRPTDLRFLDLNPAAGRIANLSPESLRGRTIRQVFPTIESAWIGVVGATARTGQPRRVEGYTAVLDRWIETYTFSLGDARVGQFFHDVSERKKAERQKELLLAELNHRVKNTLATVQSLMMQTARGAESLEHFQDAFGRRLQALSEAHDLLTRGSWINTPLGDVVSQTLAPHGPADGGRITVDGPMILLNPNAAIILNMALHELATNAAKYGALSTPDGRVAVTWTIAPEPSPAVAMSWVERDGPPVRPPARRGFGSRVIETGVAHEIEGDVRLDFQPAGLECHMRIPFSNKVMLP